VAVTPAVEFSNVKLSPLPRYSISHRFMWSFSNSGKKAPISSESSQVDSEEMTSRRRAKTSQPCLEVVQLSLDGNRLCSLRRELLQF
jgi:hypothetical protein